MPSETEVQRLANDINARLEPTSDTAVPATLETLYRQMTTLSLRTLRVAFTLDRDQTTGPDADHTRAFCQSRIDAIDRVVEGRRVVEERSE